jgi:hypothetical protein
MGHMMLNHWVFWWVIAADMGVALGIWAMDGNGWQWMAMDENGSSQL